MAFSGTGLPFASRPDPNLVLLFSSLLAIPLARQSFFDSTALARFQVKGVTFYFFDDVFLLNLTFEPAQRILKRLAFLHANLCQINYTSQSTQLGFLEYVTFVVVLKRISLGKAAFFHAFKDFGRPDGRFQGILASIEDALREG